MFLLSLEIRQEISEQSREGVACRTPWEEASGKQGAAKQKEKLSNYLSCQNTKGCEVVSCLSQEAFKHGALPRAGGRPT